MKCISFIAILRVFDAGIVSRWKDTAPLRVGHIELGIL